MHGSSNWQNCCQPTTQHGLVSLEELLADLLLTTKGWSVWQKCQQIYPPQGLVSLAELPADLPPTGLVSLTELLCGRTAGRSTTHQGSVSLAELPANYSWGLVSLAELLCSITASRSMPREGLVSLVELLCGRTAGRSTPQVLVSLTELLEDLPPRLCQSGRTASKPTPPNKGWQVWQKCCVAELPEYLPHPRVPGLLADLPMQNTTLPVISHFR